MLASPFLAFPRRSARAADGGALRVVSLDLLVTEQLMTLGAVPLACANIPLYQRLVAMPALPPQVVDVGPLQEPNRELLQALRPDLIIGMAWQSFRQDALREISAVAWLPAIDRGTSPFDYIRQQLTGLGARLGRQDQALAANGVLDAAVAAARAGLAPDIRRPVYLVRLVEDGRHAAIFGTRSMIGDVAGHLGLVNAWTGRGNGSGVAAIGIEELARVPEALIIHFDRGAETRRALARLADSPLWRALPSVRAGRIVSLPVVHPSGGVTSALRFVRDVETALKSRTDLHG